MKTKEREIPEGWKLSELQDLCIFNKGIISGPFGSSVTKNIYTTQGYKIYGQEQVLRQDSKYGDYYINTEHFEKLKNYSVQPYDVLVSLVGTFGKVLILPEDMEPGIINPRLVRIRLRKEIYPTFLKYFFESSFAYRYFSSKSHGATMPILNLHILKRTPILLPPKLEQKKIIEILTNIDIIIHYTQQFIDHLQLLKKGLMQQLFTQGIGHTEFKETQFGRIPQEWEVKNLECICKEVYRYPTYYGITYVKSGIPEIRGELILESGKITEDLTIYRYIDEETSNKFPKTILEEGDIVISVRGTMGKVGIIPNQMEGSNITANLMRISPDKEITEPKWFIQFLLSYSFQKQLENYSNFTTIRTITSTDLKKIKVPFPSKEEQVKIAHILTNLDETIEQMQNERKDIVSVKTGLLQDLLTGKKRVSVKA